jgi:hypothetical protein
VKPGVLHALAAAGTIQGDLEVLEQLLATGGAAAAPGAKGGLGAGQQPQFKRAASPAQLAAIPSCREQPEGAEERSLCSRELRPGGAGAQGASQRRSRWTACRRAAAPQGRRYCPAGGAGIVLVRCEGATATS